MIMTCIVSVLWIALCSQNSVINLPMELLAIAMMKKETGYIILDVRRPDEFAEGHIPNAINVANESIGTAEIPELPNKKQLIMVYCRSGRRSKEAAEKLVNLGYTNIVEFGGILDWTGEIVSE